MTDADARHLQRMMECLYLLRTGAISLMQGADDLLSLRDLLEAFDAFGQSWFDTFTSHVVTLESGGVASDGKVLPRHSPLEPYVVDALDTLESLVRIHLPNADAERAASAWRTAGDRLGVMVEAPYEFIWADRRHPCVAFLPHFGTHGGILVLATPPPTFDTDPTVAADAASAGVGCSFINAELYRSYDDEQFRSTLREWGYYGPSSERPRWLDDLDYGR